MFNYYRPFEAGGRCTVSAHGMFSELETGSRPKLDVLKPGTLVAHRRHGAYE